MSFQNDRELKFHSKMPVKKMVPDRYLTMDLHFDQSVRNWVLCVVGILFWNEHCTRLEKEFMVKTYHELLWSSIVLASLLSY